MAAPANDLIANAIALTTASGTLTGINNTEATVESGEPDSGKTHSVWYKFVTTDASPSAHFDQIGSGFDGFMTLYRLSYWPGIIVPYWGSLTYIASDDDSGGGGAASFTTAISMGLFYVKWAAFSSGSTTSGILNWSGLTSIDPTCGQGASYAWFSSLAQIAAADRSGLGPGRPTSGIMWPRGVRQ
jgi:hypothetical protein